MNFQETAYFKEKAKERYKIETQTQTRVRCSIIIGFRWHSDARGDDHIRRQSEKESCPL